LSRWIFLRQLPGDSGDIHVMLDDNAFGGVSVAWLAGVKLAKSQPNNTIAHPCKN